MTTLTKQEAHSKVAYALRAGRLIRASECSTCRTPGRVEAHHDDYDKPYDVIWLCRGCHARQHGNSWKGNWTHCPKGHEFTPENTVYWGSTRRRCRICHNEWQRQRRAAVAI